MQQAEPRKFSAEEVENNSLAALLEPRVSIARVLQHHREVTDVFGAMYADVAFKQTQVNVFRPLQASVCQFYKMFRRRWI